jgi:hypothetical protein
MMDFRGLRTGLATGFAWLAVMAVVVPSSADAGPGISPAEQRFQQKLGSARDMLRQQGDVARHHRQAPYNKWRLQNAGRADFNELERRGNQARATRNPPARAKPATPRVHGSPNRSTWTRPHHARGLEHRGRLAQQARGYRHADDAARLGRTGRTARHAGHAARTADTASDAGRAARHARTAAKAGKTAKTLAAGVGAGVGGIVGGEVLTATTGFDIPVVEYGVRAAATPFVAAEGGDGGAYFVDQSEWFVGEVETGFRHFGQTLSGERSVDQNLRAYERDNADLLKAGCVAANTAALTSLSNLIAGKKPLDNC